MIKSALLFSLFAGPCLAADPVVVAATAVRSSMGWRFDVTLEHGDTGWEHYADGWEIRDQFGTRLAYRELYHPHIDEQPFTRSQSGVMLPDGIRVVYARARCSVDGWSNVQTEMELSR